MRIYAFEIAEMAMRGEGHAACKFMALCIVLSRMTIGRLILYNPVKLAELSVLSLCMCRITHQKLCSSRRSHYNLCQPKMMARLG
jgi:hypothetical protein